MSRTPHKPATTLPDPGTAAEAHAMTISADQQAHDIEREAAFHAAKIVGRVETALFYETISQKVVVESYLELKKNNAFMAITYRDADGNVKRISCLHEFCERVFKKTYRRVQQLVDNYHTIGADLFDAAEQIGFRQKDYQALKALPAADQAIIKQAMAEETDRDQVIGLLQEMAVSHASEKAALTAKAKEAEDTAADRDRVIGSKQDQISALEVRLASAERRQSAFTDDETRDYECAPLHETINDAMLALAKMEVEVARLTSDVGGELVRTECEHALALIAQRAIEISETYRMPLNRDSLLGDYSALELRAAGLSPEALQ